MHIDRLCCSVNLNIHLSTEANRPMYRDRLCSSNNINIQLSMETAPARYL